MKITLPHYTNQAQAIKKIDDKLNEALRMKLPGGVQLVDPQKNWDNNIMRFSFGVKRLFLNLHFAGILIVTDQEAVGEAEIPSIVTDYFSEETIKDVIRKEFNKLFNIN